MIHGLVWKKKKQTNLNKYRYNDHVLYYDDGQCSCW
jgi:hypothetical protein